jgi:uncharacterized membrane protein
VAGGSCTVTSSGLNNNVGSVTFTVADVSHATLSYQPALYDTPVYITVDNPSLVQGFLGGSWLLLALVATTVSGWTGFRPRRRR